jgi:hypothetical protein
VRPVDSWFEFFYEGKLRCVCIARQEWLYTDLEEMIALTGRGYGYGAAVLHGRAVLGHVSELPFQIILTTVSIPVIILSNLCQRRR